VDKGKFSIVFMGTPEFACPSLENLAKKEKVVAVVTQPDKPAGRGKKLTPSPVKLLADKRGIPIYQPKTIEDLVFLKKINSLKPDLIVVVAFGKILPSKIMSIPRIFPINLHPSLLPKFKGPAPIPWALIKGETKTGVTVQRMREEVDSGEIILQSELPIEPEDNCETLTKKLSRMGAKTLIEAIELIKKGKFQLKPQQGEVSYAPKITKEISKINWTAPAWEIHNLVRGLTPLPGVFTTFLRKGKSCRLKIWKTALFKEDNLQKKISPGTIIKIQKEKGFVVQTGKGTLLVKEVQLPDKAKINAYDFIKGYHIKEGFLLGNESLSLSR